MCSCVQEKALLRSMVSSRKLVGVHGKTAVTKMSPGCSEGWHDCTSGTNNTPNLEALATLLGAQYL